MSANVHFNTIAADRLNSKLDEFVLEVKAFSEKEFLEDNAFSIIYGSYAYGMDTPNSDIDIMFVSDDCNQARMSRCIDLVLSIHAKNNLPLDTEISYEHKVLIPTDFLKRAVSGVGFKKDDGSFYIPKIEKTKECLESEGLRLRFLHGLMAHKHIFVDGDNQTYLNLRDQAKDMLVTAITAARGHKIVTPTLLKDLLYSNGEDFGDFYLGFKDSPIQHDYLNDLCSQTLNKLANQSRITYRGSYFDVSPLHGVTTNFKPASFDNI